MDKYMNEVMFDALAREFALDVICHVPDSVYLSRFRGMDDADLPFLKERVMLHARDFEPEQLDSPARYRESVGHTVDHWLGTVETAGKLGLKEPAFTIDYNAFHDDRGKYFIAPSGLLRCCTKATREAMWAPGGTESPSVVEVPLEKVPFHEVSFLLARFGRDLPDGGRVVDLVSPLQMPDGSVVDAVMDSGNPSIGHLFLTRPEDGVTYRQDALLEELDGFYRPALPFLCRFLEGEVSRQVCGEMTREADRRNLWAYFRGVADGLLDAHGTRIRSDRLYDEVELHPDELVEFERCSLRRSVDVVSPDSRSYYFFCENVGRDVRLEEVTPDNMSFLEGVLADVEKEVSIRSGLREGSLEDVMIFKDGPVVAGIRNWPANEALRVEKLSSYPDGRVVVAGTVVDIDLPGASKVTGMKGSAVLDDLSDSGIEAVRKASDDYIRHLMSRLHNPVKRVVDSLSTGRPARKAERGRSV